MMKKNNQKGFSLIELLLVCVVIAIVAAIAVPLVSRAIAAAENGSTNATMRTILTAQSLHFSQKSRYARLDEVNTIQNEGLGQVSNDQLLRGKFVFEMVPANPTDDELKMSFRVIATRVTGSNELPYVVEIDQGGFVSQIFP